LLIKSSPQKALKMLFESFYENLCSHVFALLRNKNASEDIVQDVLLEIWKKRDEININISLEAYLKRACRNKALNYIRSNKILFEDVELAETIESNYSDPQEMIEIQNLQDIINKGIDKLPEKCRIVFLLSRMENLSYNEIAEKLDISIKTVENQISKALKILREFVYIENSVYVNRGN